MSNNVISIGRKPQAKPEREEKDTDFAETIKKNAATKQREADDRAKQNKKIVRGLKPRPK